MKSHTVLYVLFALLSFLSCNKKAATETNKHPNIILIYADDLGIGLLGHEGQQIISTPHIDKLAQEGVRFSNYFSCMLCSPSRASLISGRHNCHADAPEMNHGGAYKKISSRKYTYQQVDSAINSRLSPEPDDAVFLGQVAQKAGYKTAQFGKLEWGFSSTHNQLVRHGWDYYLGYLDHQRAHGFYPPFLFENGKKVNFEGNTHANCAKTKEPETPAAYQARWNMEGKKHYAQHIFMDSLLRFIDTHKDEPFFIYLPTQLPHGPVSVPAVHPDFADIDSLTQIEKEYASMVKMLDDNVGQIMSKLKSLQLDENTVVMFSSDNGHEIYHTQKGRATKPYRNMQTGERFDNLSSKYYSDLGGDVFNGNAGRAGLKRSNLQGGLEAPLIIRWPKTIEAGKVNHSLVANYDLVKTLADLTGYSGKFESDGLSFYPELIGQQPTQQHDYLVFSSFEGPTLISNDGWKLRTYIQKNTKEKTIMELYYLPDDYREEHNLADKHPDKVAALKAKLLEACDGNLHNGWYRGKNLTATGLH